MTDESEPAWREINDKVSSLRNHNRETTLSTTSTPQKDTNSERVGYVMASVLTISILVVLGLLPFHDSVPEPSSITPALFLFVVGFGCLLVVLPLAYFFEGQMKCYQAFRCYRYVHYSVVQHRFINVAVWRRVDSGTA